MKSGHSANAHNPVRLRSGGVGSFDPVLQKERAVNAQQETIQAVNRTIREFAEDPRIPPNETWDFFCECGCFTLVAMTIAEFDGGGGVWVAGHKGSEVSAAA
jgi:hypothetical protein